MAWREIGGPPVKPPTRSGFGSVIIERTIPFDLHGTAAVRYPIAGFEADLFIPARHLVASTGQDGHRGPAIQATVAPASAVPTTQPLKGLRVLVLEDNMIVALTAENLLEDLGAVCVWPASHVEGARRYWTAKSSISRCWTSIWARKRASDWRCACGRRRSRSSSPAAMATTRGWATIWRAASSSANLMESTICSARSRWCCATQLLQDGGPRLAAQGKRFSVHLSATGDRP